MQEKNEKITKNAKLRKQIWKAQFLYRIFVADFGFSTTKVQIFMHKTKNVIFFAIFDRFGVFLTKIDRFLMHATCENRHFNACYLFDYQMTLQ